MFLTNLEWTAGAPGNRLDKVLSKTFGLGPASIKRAREAYILGTAVTMSSMIVGLTGAYLQAERPIPSWLYRRGLGMTLLMIFIEFCVSPLTLVLICKLDPLDEKIVKNRKDVQEIKDDLEKLRYWARMMTLMRMDTEMDPGELVKDKEEWDSWFDCVERQLGGFQHKEEAFGRYLPEEDMGREQNALLDGECFRQQEDLRKFKDGMETASLCKKGQHAGYGTFECHNV